MMLSLSTIKKRCVHFVLFSFLHDQVTPNRSYQITLMDWGNAIVRSKTVDASGKITKIEMDLNLAGDFRKTKKKITWLSAPTPSHPLIDVTLLDYDYLITKKKLEENDEVKDFVTPETEFREEALADANVRDLKKGDIIQFERKGYYIFDGPSAAEDNNGKLEFIHIPDGRAASIASKAGTTPATPAGIATPVVPLPKKGAAVSAAAPEGGKLDAVPGSDTPADTKMYGVKKVYGDEAITTPADTKMYKVSNVYSS